MNDEQAELIDELQELAEVIAEELGFEQAKMLFDLADNFRKTFN